MLSVISSCTFSGIEALPVTVEVDLAPGLPGFTMVGLPDSAVKESRERVFAALKNSGFSVPSKRITVNLAPGGIRKEGTAFDLALALGLLIASEQVDLPPLPPFLILGELSLDGRLRPVRGVLPAALHAKAVGRPGLLVPWENGAEAAMVPGVAVHALVNLAEVLEFLRDPKAASCRPSVAQTEAYGGDALDFSEVKGQEQAKRALEVAAAGGHNVLMVGSPGCGKSLLARRLPTILPPLSPEEALETTRVYSVAGLLRDGMGLLQRRPFRSPHHSISSAALLGGGAAGRPGEISLAHNGVLFLDEFPEFRRDVAEALRQPLEEGIIAVSRAAYKLTYPCRVMLAAAMNPCPCGRLGEARKTCQCRTEEIIRYRARLSGPLLDRMDIHLELSGLTYGEMTGPAPVECSADLRRRVEVAREVQLERFTRDAAGKGMPPEPPLGAEAGDLPVSCNAQMAAAQLRSHCALDHAGRALLKDAMASLGLSARAYDRILKVARTVADLEGSRGIRDDHVAEAIHYRTLDRAHLPAFP